MPQPRILILRAPGANCDGETEFAFQQAGGLPERLHINRLRENPKLRKNFQILAIPGGFAYGDDVAAGKILANQLQHFLADALLQAYRTGTPAAMERHWSLTWHRRNWQGMRS